MAFQHDPNWRMRFMSIQSVADAINGAGGHWAWRIIAPGIVLLIGFGYGYATYLMMRGY